MKAQGLLLALLFTSICLFAQETTPPKKMDWNGYAQLRGTTNFDDHSGFAVRRLKFWIKSTPAFSEHWSYKVQALFTSFLQERFFLQDAKATYKTGLFSFDVGQFIPKYSLEWTQPDYKIPAIERAISINTLSPNGTLGVRDIGAQVNFSTKNNLLQTSAGVFNGYGIVEYRFKNKGYLLTHKTAINIPVQHNAFQFGYSLLYRKAEDLRIPKVLPDTLRFTGTDMRANFFAMYVSKLFTVQAEYLNADFDGSKAYGYYFLSAINIKKSQIVLSFEDYKDLIPETSNKPYYRLGYNYLIDKHNLMLFLDNYFQLDENGIGNFYTTIQLQIFFN